jgi:hypothetical protein
MRGRSSVGGGRSRRGASPDFASTAGFREAVCFLRQFQLTEKETSPCCRLHLVQKSARSAVARGQWWSAARRGFEPRLAQVPPFFSSILIGGPWRGRPPGLVAIGPRPCFLFLFFLLLKPAEVGLWPLGPEEELGLPAASPPGLGCPLPFLFFFFSFCFSFSV